MKRRVYWLLLAAVVVCLNAGHLAYSDGSKGFCTPIPCPCYNQGTGACYTSGTWGQCDPTQGTGCVPKTWTCSGTFYTRPCGQGGNQVGPCSQYNNGCNG
jgi:hypothetical protein